METNDQNINIDLIARYLAGEATAQEISDFKAWLKADPSHEKTFNEYKKVWEEMGKVEKIAGLDVQAEWKIFENKLIANERTFEGSPEIEPEGDQPVAPGRVRTLSFYLVRIAAVVVIAFLTSLAGIYTYRNIGYSEYITENQVEEIGLPDGSTITLNAHSMIRYHKRFKGDARTVEFTGEGFFEVEPDPQKPFVILTGQVEIEVLGTTFNVYAYGKNSQVEVIVNSGQVAVTRKGEIVEKIILKAGNKGTYNRKDQSLKLTINRDPNYLSWKTRNFIFEDCPLEEVVETLNKAYQSSIIIPDDSLRHTRITTSFDDQSLEAILNVLEATLDLDIEKTNGTVELRMK